jgi:hypothetical protein
LSTSVFATPERAEIAHRVGDPRTSLDPAVAANMLAKLTRTEIERAEPDVDYVGIMTDPWLRTSGAIFDTCIGSLGVLGYGRVWLARVLRVDERHLAPGKGSREINPKLMHRALTAAIRIGSRWATPESTGQTAEQIEAAQQQALRAGYRVPAAYGNRYDGQAPSAGTPRTPPPPPQIGQWRRTVEETTIAKIQALAYFCEHGGTETGLRSRFDLSERTLGRARREDLGMEVVPAGLNTFRPAPGQEDLVAEIVKAANALAVEEPKVVWKRLRAYAADRRERVAAEEAARAVAANAAEQAAKEAEVAQLPRPAHPVPQHAQREDSAA